MVTLTRLATSALRYRPHRSAERYRMQNSSKWFNVFTIIIATTNGRLFFLAAAFEGKKQAAVLCVCYHYSSGVQHTLLWPADRRRLMENLLTRRLLIRY